jgi:hypothetical protein
MKSKVKMQYPVPVDSKYVPGLQRMHAEAPAARNPVGSDQSGSKSHLADHGRRTANMGCPSNMQTCTMQSTQPFRLIEEFSVPGRSLQIHKCPTFLPNVYYDSLLACELVFSPDTSCKHSALCDSVHYFLAIAFPQETDSQRQHGR